jgi:2-keto-4-pentenoate hydratase/2-oxohepta-3-ene-1,7-dioic acid hydratase in catechol pathway
VKLVTLDLGAGGQLGAMLSDGELIHLGRAAQKGTVETWLPGSMRGLLEAGDEGLAIARRVVQRVASGDERLKAQWRADGVLLPKDTSLLAPVPDARLVLAAGLAYRSHLAEMAGTPAPAHPTAFLKSPHSIGHPGALILLPQQTPHMVDYEGELALVFGKRCHRVAVQDALSCIAGCTVANDVSARDWVEAVWSSAQPWAARQTWEVNIMGKQFTGFTPMGPCLMTLDELPSIPSLRLTTRLNGTVVQSAEISDLIFTLQETIAYFSRWYTFEPGDVLLTGTPAGVGVGRKPRLFMKHGDTVEIEIDGIGVLRNRVELGA